MKPWMICLAVLTWIGALHAQHYPYENAVQQKFASGGTIRLHLEAGGYTISPTDAGDIVVTYHANSSAQLDKVKVEIKPGIATADVYVSRTPNNKFSATIEVPRQSNLWVRLSAGQLDLENIDGDKDVEMWAGELDIEVPHPEVYGHRDASVLAGSLDAAVFNVSKGGLFRSFSDQGPGKYRLHAHVTTGGIDLHGTE